MAIMTALSGLDKEYSSSEYLLKMKADFETIVLTLDGMAKRHYKELAASNGKVDKMASQEVKYYSVEEAARFHRVTEETIRKAIRDGRIQATGKPYKITESGVIGFSPKKWNRRD